MPGTRAGLRRPCRAGKRGPQAPRAGNDRPIDRFPHAATKMRPKSDHGVSAVRPGVVTAYAPLDRGDRFALASAKQTVTTTAVETRPRVTFDTLDSASQP